VAGEADKTQLDDSSFYVEMSRVKTISLTNPSSSGILLGGEAFLFVKCFEWVVEAYKLLILSAFHKPVKKHSSSAFAR